MFAFAFQAIIGVLAFCTTFAYAAPAFTGANLEITQLSTYASNGTGGNGAQNVGLSFILHDPDPLTNSSAICTGSWGLNETYPTGGYVPCSNSTFGWNFDEDSFKNIHDFTLQVKHTFTDPSVGQPPYDKVTTFAKTSVSNLTCATTVRETHCQQRNGSVIEAPIWAAMARRR